MNGIQQVFDDSLLGRLSNRIKKLEEALLDIRTHSVPPFIGPKWSKYINEVATAALSNGGSSNG